MALTGASYRMSPGSGPDTARNADYLLISRLDESAGRCARSSSSALWRGIAGCCPDPVRRGELWGGYGRFSAVVGVLPDRARHSASHWRSASPPGRSSIQPAGTCRGAAERARAADGQGRAMRSGGPDLTCGWRELNPGSLSPAARVRRRRRVLPAVSCRLLASFRRRAYARRWAPISRFGVASAPLGDDCSRERRARTADFSLYPLLDRNCHPPAGGVGRGLRVRAGSEIVS